MVFEDNNQHPLFKKIALLSELRRDFDFIKGLRQEWSQWKLRLVTVKSGNNCVALLQNLQFKNTTDSRARLPERVEALNPLTECDANVKLNPDLIQANLKP